MSQTTCPSCSFTFDDQRPGGAEALRARMLYGPERLIGKPRVDAAAFDRCPNCGNRFVAPEVESMGAFARAKLRSMGAIYGAVALVAVALVLLSLAAKAEMVYKSVAADGSVTYSSHPQPDAKQVTPIDIHTLSPEERRAADRVRKQTEATLTKDFSDRDDAWRKADADIRNATEELKAAEAALEAGREPAEDEWIGNAGGGTRLREGYFARLKVLEDDVARAKAKLDRAFAARDALD